MHNSLVGARNQLYHGNKPLELSGVSMPLGFQGRGGQDRVLIFIMDQPLQGLQDEFPILRAEEGRTVRILEAPKDVRICIHRPPLHPGDLPDHFRIPREVERELGNMLSVVPLGTISIHPGDHGLDQRQMLAGLGDELGHQTPDLVTYGIPIALIATDTLELLLYLPSFEEESHQLGAI